MVAPATFQTHLEAALLWRPLWRTLKQTAGPVPRPSEDPGARARLPQPHTRPQRVTSSAACDGHRAPEAEKASRALFPDPESLRGLIRSSLRRTEHRPQLTARLSEPPGPRGSTRAPGPGELC